MSRVILLIGLGLGNKKAPGRGAFLLCVPPSTTKAKPFLFDAGIEFWNLRRSRYFFLSMAMEVSGLSVKRDRNEIVEELKRSAERGNVLGLFIDGQDEMITTAVTSLSSTDESETIIHFQRTDLHGYPLEENPVVLNKIKSVIRFNTRFDDPVYARIRQRKSTDNLAA